MPPDANGKSHDHGHHHDHDKGHEQDDGHEHGHGHGHGHGEQHSDRPVKKPPRDKAETDAATAATERRQARRLLLVLVVIAAFFVVELLGAKAARSDVLEADAYHLLMDVFALAISLGAMRLATRRPSARFTFGLRRVEPLAALVNGVLVFGVVIELVRDSLQHLANPTMPRSNIMLIVATAALVVNGFSAWILHGAMHGHAGHSHAGHSHAPPPALASATALASAAAPTDEDEGHHADAHAHHLNLRGAWLHLLGDALGSCAAFIAGVAIKYGASPIVDPLASFLVVAILVIGALRLVRDAGLVLLDAAPPRLPVARVRKVVLAHPGVVKVHALHVWSLGTGHDAVTVHVTADGVDPDLGTRLGDVLRTKFEAEYVTVQVERVETEANSVPPSSCASGD
jgi:cobalt-zinc-cadmium efflux system protein